mgnify:CR=1 FL=1
MRELAEELGVHYRIRKDNLHAKAGNINAAPAPSAAAWAEAASSEVAGGEPLRVALTETMNFEGATGPITFEPALAISKAVPILKVKDGDFAFVETLVP